MRSKAGNALFLDRWFCRRRLSHRGIFLSVAGLREDSERDRRFALLWRQVRGGGIWRVNRQRLRLWYRCGGRLVARSLLRPFGGSIGRGSVVAPTLRRHAFNAISAAARTRAEASL